MAYNFYKKVGLTYYNILDLCEPKNGYTGSLPTSTIYDDAYGTDDLLKKILPNNLGSPSYSGGEGYGYRTTTAENMNLYPGGSAAQFRPKGTAPRGILRYTLSTLDTDTYLSPSSIPGMPFAITDMDIRIVGGGGSGGQGGANGGGVGSAGNGSSGNFGNSSYFYWNTGGTNQIIAYAGNGGGGGIYNGAGAAGGSGGGVYNNSSASGGALLFIHDATVVSYGTNNLAGGTGGRGSDSTGGTSGDSRSYAGNTPGYSYNLCFIAYDGNYSPYIPTSWGGAAGYINSSGGCGGGGANGTWGANSPGDGNSGQTSDSVPAFFEERLGGGSGGGSGGGFALFVAASGGGGGGGGGGSLIARVYVASGSTITVKRGSGGAGKPINNPPACVRYGGGSGNAAHGVVEIYY